MLKKAFIFASASHQLILFRGQLILDLLSAGFEVHISTPDITTDTLAKEWLDNNDVRWYETPLKRTGLNPLYDLTSLFHLVKLIKSIKPDLFIAYTIKPVIWGTFAAAKAKVPKRVALITGLGYAFTGKPSGKRRVIQYIARKLYASALRRATLIFFQNKDDKRDFSRLGLLPAHVPVHIVNGSGINVDEFPESPLPTQPVSFLLIARLLGDKGIREYIDAARLIKQQHPEVTFHLVGGLDSNPDALKHSEVEAWCNEGIVQWHGHQSDVRSFINACCHVYVLPSYREGTPRSVLEAMAMGRAIITTDAPGCRETVIHGENGYLVPVQSVEPLAAAMEAFIKQPELITAMGQRSREIAVEKYDVHKVNETMFKAMGVH